MSPLRNLIATVLVGVAATARAEPTALAMPASGEAASPSSGAASPPAAAPQAPEGSPAPHLEPTSVRSSDAELPLFGLLLDGGFPDGIGLSAVARPWRPLRADVGFTYNVLGFGVRAGATILPLAWSVSPLLRAELGHAFESDASGLARTFGVRTSDSLYLRAVSYDYASLQLGVQLGRAERYAFVVQAGLTWFRGPVKDFQAGVRAANPTSTIEVADPTVSGSVPCASVGFVFFP